jgi:sterol desaturase/sphingolipid hydroxylase (fatty acid hydroxylase superfamily)
MRAECHAVLGGAAAAGLAPVLGVSSLAFFAASVLIDFDHYLDYVYRNRFVDFSVRRMFRFASALDSRSRGRATVQLSVFHTIEALLVMLAAAALTGWPALWAVLWGALFHMMVDTAGLLREGTPFVRAYSIIEYGVRWARLERRGEQPRLPYELALQDTLAGTGSGPRKSR